LRPTAMIAPSSKTKRLDQTDCKFRNPLATLAGKSIGV
jgi:hypothetical protein